MLGMVDKMTTYILETKDPTFAGVTQQAGAQTVVVGELKGDRQMKDIPRSLYRVADGYVTKEWTRLFLKNWNIAVALWDDGHMFKQHQETGQYDPYQLRDQQEYARICCSWILPNGFQEPHVVAEGG